MGHYMFSVYLTQTPASAQHTLIGWIVEDIEQMTDEMRAMGVTFQQYDFPSFSTNEKGIGLVEGEKGAWFRDSDGNLLSIWETERYSAECRAGGDDALKQHRTQPCGWTSMTVTRRALESGATSVFWPRPSVRRRQRAWAHSRCFRPSGSARLANGPRPTRG